MSRLGLLAIAALSGACYGGRPACLSGPTPQVADHPRESELLELARLEYDRSEQGPPELRGRLLERFPSLLPDLGIGRGVPECASEFVQELSDATFASEPIAFDALLVSRIRAVGNVGDTTDVMPQKAGFLLALAEIPDSRLTDYRRLPGERGTPPPKALVRQLALGELSASNLFYNDKRVQSYLTARVRSSQDPRELLLLHAAAAQDFREGRLAQKPSDPKPRLLGSWLDQLPAQVARSAGPEELELVLLRLRLIGVYSQPFFEGDRARSLLSELYARAHELAIASAHAGIARDLKLSLRSALFDLERKQDVGFVEPTGFPRAHRPDFNPYETWLAPTTIELSSELAQRRLKELESDLENFEYSSSRCAILSELPRYAQSESAAKLFDFLVSPAPKPRTRTVDETNCRIAAALELPKLETRKAMLLARLVEPNRLAKDGEGMIDGVVAGHLNDYPELMAERPELRRWALSRAERPAMSSWGALHAIVQAAMTMPDSNPDTRAKILRGWIRELQTLPTSGRARRPPHFRGIDRWSETILQQRLFTIAELAKANGLEAEARALVSALLQRFGGRRDDYTAVGLARAAVIAQTLLDLS